MIKGFCCLLSTHPKKEKFSIPAAPNPGFFGNEESSCGISVLIPGVFQVIPKEVWDLLRVGEEGEGARNSWENLGLPGRESHPDRSRAFSTRTGTPNPKSRWARRKSRPCPAGKRRTREFPILGGSGSCTHPGRGLGSQNSGMRSSGSSFRLCLLPGSKLRVPNHRTPLELEFP